MVSHAPGGCINKGGSSVIPQKHSRIVIVATVAAVALVGALSAGSITQQQVESTGPEPATLAFADVPDSPAAGQGNVATGDLAPSIAAARRQQDSSPSPPSSSTPSTPTTTGPPSNNPSLAYFNDFSAASDTNRLDHFVHYRDPFVVNHTTGVSDHAPNGSVNCMAPETTRAQTRGNPRGHIYQCHPAGDPALGHMMAYAMDSSGYGFVGGLPDQVFEGVEEVSVDINTTSAGTRNFVEIKVLPAAQTYVNAMPCGPDLPCNDGWDYDDLGGVGASTNASDGTGLVINTPNRPDGHIFDYYNRTTDSNGDVNYASCDLNSSYCFEATVHEGNEGIRARFRHVFRDNGNGTLSFGIDSGTEMHWVTAPGSFPDGPVRVVVAFHNYTGTKDGEGPGFDNNVSPTQGGFTWHWDNLAVVAEQATPSAQHFGGNSADRIVTPNGCIAFSQGQRGTSHNTDIAPEMRCS